jgi:hypothetical protein
MLDHQLSSAISLVPRALNPLAETPDADTWREVNEPKKEGVHFCIGKGDLPGVQRPERHPALDDIHIDWFSPVEGIEPLTGRCNYLELWEGSAQHWFQAHFGYENPVFTFERIEEAITKGRELAAKAEHGPAAPFHDFVASWEKEKYTLAVRGKTGYDASLLRHQEFEKILRALGV